MIRNLKCSIVIESWKDYDGNDPQELGFYDWTETNNNWLIIKFKTDERTNFYGFKLLWECISPITTTISTTATSEETTTTTTDAMTTKTTDLSTIKIQTQRSFVDE